MRVVDDLPPEDNRSGVASRWLRTESGLWRWRRTSPRGLGAVVTGRTGTPCSEPGALAGLRPAPSGVHGTRGHSRCGSTAIGPPMETNRAHLRYADAPQLAMAPIMAMACARTNPIWRPPHVRSPNCVGMGAASAPAKAEIPFCLYHSSRHATVSRPRRPLPSLSLTWVSQFGHAAAGSADATPRQHDLAAARSR